MEKYITDERTGLKYELIGDYYLIAGEDEPEQEPIGIWGQRHLRYLKKCHCVRYANLLTSGKMNAYLADIDLQAEELFSACKTNGRCRGNYGKTESPRPNGMGQADEQRPKHCNGTRKRRNDFRIISRLQYRFSCAAILTKHHASWVITHGNISLSFCCTLCHL